MNLKVSKEIPFFLSFISDEEKAAAKSQSNASLLTLLLTFGSSTFISVILGGTIEATWLLFGCIQLMSFVPLFNLNLPGNFREFSKNLAALHGEPGILPNLFENFINSTELEPYNDFFDLMSNNLFITKYRFQNNTFGDELWKKNGIMGNHVFNDGNHILPIWYNWRSQMVTI